MRCRIITFTCALILMNCSVAKFCETLLNNSKRLFQLVLSDYQRWREPVTDTYESCHILQKYSVPTWWCCCELAWWGAHSSRTVLIWKCDLKGIKFNSRNFTSRQTSHDLMWSSITIAFKSPFPRTVLTIVDLQLVSSDLHMRMPYMLYTCVIVY